MPGVRTDKNSKACLNEQSTSASSLVTNYPYTLILTIQIIIHLFHLLLALRHPLYSQNNTELTPIY
jgi:hypothetical protein